MDLRREGHWDEHYQLELDNFEQNGDEGEVWFGVGLNRRIVDWIVQEIVRSRRESQADRITPVVSLVDIGCGNAFLLCSLREKLESTFANSGANWTLTGLDYSSNAIELGKKVISSRGYNEDRIRVHRCDLLDLKQVEETTERIKYDFIVDKGTLDAIGLLASDSEAKLKEAHGKYMRAIRSMSKVGTLFVLASCNSTRDELADILEAAEEKDFTALRFSAIGSIETPKIHFGGKVGSQVTCLLYRVVS